MPLEAGSSGRDVAQKSNSSHYVFLLNLNTETFEETRAKQSCDYHKILRWKCGEIMKNRKAPPLPAAHYACFLDWCISIYKGNNGEMGNMIAGRFSDKINVISGDLQRRNCSAIALLYMFPHRLTRRYTMVKKILEERIVDALLLTISQLIS